MSTLCQGPFSPTELGSSDAFCSGSLACPTVVNLSSPGPRSHLFFSLLPYILPSLPRCSPLALSSLDANGQNTHFISPIGSPSPSSPPQKIGWRWTISPSPASSHYSQPVINVGNNSSPGTDPTPRTHSDGGGVASSNQFDYLHSLLLWRAGRGRGRAPELFNAQWHCQELLGKREKNKTEKYHHATAQIHGFRKEQPRWSRVWNSFHTRRDYKD